MKSKIVVLDDVYEGELLSVMLKTKEGEIEVPSGIIKKIEIWEE